MKHNSSYITLFNHGDTPLDLGFSFVNFTVCESSGCLETDIKFRDKNTKITKTNKTGANIIIYAYVSNFIRSQNLNCVLRFFEDM